MSEIETANANNEFSVEPALLVRGFARAANVVKGLRNSLQELIEQSLAAVGVDREQPGE